MRISYAVVKKKIFFYFSLMILHLTIYRNDSYLRSPASVLLNIIIVQEKASLDRKKQEKITKEI